MSGLDDSEGGPDIRSEKMNYVFDIFIVQKGFKMKKHLRIMALFLAVLLLSSCTNSTVPTVSDAVTTAAAPDDGTVVLAENGEAKYTIIRAETASDTVSSMIGTFKKKINDMLGIQYPIGTDWVSRDEKENVVTSSAEFLIGNTNRVETAQLLQEVGSNGYGFRIINNKIVIAAAGDSRLSLALQEFAERVLDNPERFADGKLIVKPEDEFIEVDTRPIQLSDLISTGTKFRVSLTQVIYASPLNEYKTAQGAASDGEYAYFLLRTGADGYARIAKYSLETGRICGASDPVYVLHGNDMTYCKSQNLLYLVHGSSEGKTVTTMDPDTLQVVEQSVSLPYGAGAMTYSWEKDLFCFSQGGGSFYVMTPEKELKIGKKKSATSGYTAQGMGSDEHYVYFPMSANSGQKDNILMVYDWSGNYITDVHLPIEYESETMFWVNDTYYVSFNKGGARLYRLDFIPEY